MRRYRKRRQALKVAWCDDTTQHAPLEASWVSSSDSMGDSSLECTPIGANFLNFTADHSVVFPVVAVGPQLPPPPPPRRPPPPPPRLPPPPPWREQSSELVLPPPPGSSPSQKPVVPPLLGSRPSFKKARFYTACKPRYSTWVCKGIHFDQETECDMCRIVSFPGHARA